MPMTIAVVHLTSLRNDEYLSLSYQYPQVIVDISFMKVKSEALNETY